ncbi:MAG: LysM peptidoglycan-binding domain-containing protein [Ilumatobacteraceae bacterium]
MARLPRLLLASALGLAIGTSCLVDVADAAPSGATLQSTYTVRSGDYLSGIAYRLNVSLRDLLRSNDLTVTSLILPGQVLRVPVTAATAGAATVPASSPKASPSSSATYTVRNGDFLTGIAATLGVTTRSLLTANRLQINSLIYPGMRLTVPKGGALPTASDAVTTSTSAPKPRVPAAKAGYTVVAGDTLSGIAVKLGVTLRSLLATNQLTTSSFIHPGMALVVPKGGTLPVAASPVTTTAPSTTAPSTTAPGSPSPSAPAATGGPTFKGDLTKVIAFARAQIGKPYKAFAVGPNSYDCSGLTMAAYATIGAKIPHYSGAQMSFGAVVDWTTEPVKAGDLIFFETAAGSGVIGHVGIATSATTWIQAPRTGDVVREGTFNVNRIVGVRRLVNG